MKLQRAIALSLLALPGLLACGASDAAGGSSSGINVAFVTNGVDPFWTIAEGGAAAGAADFDVNCDTRMPSLDPGDQKRIIEDLLTRGVDGIAISPISPENQISFLNMAAEKTHLITHDSDAAGSNRLCYVGMDNYDAGRMVGELVKEAIPDGGSIIIFVGRIEQDNARRRRQGVIDEILGRSHDPSRYDEPSAKLEGDKYTILDTRTDGFDQAKAKSQAEDSLALYPDLACMVGLFAYNPVQCLAALTESGRISTVKLVGFDEDPRTLAGIEAGLVHGTVVQDPYKYGYESVRILAGLARGDKSVLPEGGILHIPARKITKENVVQFRDDLTAKKAAGEKAEAARSEGK